MTTSLRNVIQRQSPGALSGVFICFLGIYGTALRKLRSSVLRSLSMPFMATSLPFHFRHTSIATVNPHDLDLPIRRLVTTATVTSPQVNSPPRSHAMQIPHSIPTSSPTQSENKKVQKSPITPSFAKNLTTPDAGRSQPSRGAEALIWQQRR